MDGETDVSFAKDDSCQASSHGLLICLTSGISMQSQMSMSTEVDKISFGLLMFKERKGEISACTLSGLPMLRRFVFRIRFAVQSWGPGSPG